jgi:hypothetical protein
MSDDESRLLEEVDFWLRLNNDYLLKHGKQPTRRMQEALFHALDRLRELRGPEAEEGDAYPRLEHLRPLTETLN